MNITNTPKYAPVRPDGSVPCAANVVAALVKEARSLAALMRARDWANTALMLDYDSRYPDRFGHLWWHKVAAGLDGAIAYSIGGWAVEGFSLPSAAQQDEGVGS